MDGMLSQEEINALLGNMTGDDSSPSSDSGISLTTGTGCGRRDFQYLYGYGGHNPVFPCQPEGNHYNAVCIDLYMG